MIKKGIRRQIVLHYFFVVFLALLLAEVVFLFAMRTYYYDTIYRHIELHADYVSDLTQPLRMPGQSLNANMINNFKIERTLLEVLDEQGNVIINSSGFESKRKIQTSDVAQALTGGTGRWVGKQSGTGQQVMAVSKKLSGISGDEVYILRYVTSLQAVNDRIFYITLLSISVGAAVLTIVLIFSIGLANSIVRPLNDITEVSAQMAKGKFDVRITGNYRHELGELASTLNYMAQEVVHTNQVKDDFISSISHELRTPLTSIKGWSETLNSGGFDPDETKIGMQIISKETDRLIGLVEEILDFSKLQSNEMKLVMGSVDLRELLQEIMLNVWAKAELKKIKLSLDVEERPYLVHGDGNRLKQVFLNIVDNAVKFSHESSSIYITIRKEDQQMAVSIQDTGIGISEEHLHKVRDRFFQVDHQNGGTGLGLAISQQFVERHGGELLMNSVLGQGTTVTVKLPALEEPSGTTDISEAEPAQQPN
ncbi:HAMP domain-containing histidine kinase [Paenibacillus sp. P96]|uniref:histidine kinase n=1 Tax=Paenibacillus zeirhizosphaerae TaxID=2987519 RepID=A0ABT9FVD8_9BACL|nr:HAMP domain-containing sensor histidine kinase [Paenibacillus sp. P96]MDP4098655.1 HAMP domain-containing histidine kinase [Paenibacillus sp. P96]